ncbi:hypothetical protein ACJIZ3_004944 [Penstemon smallii]|uniref:FLZ-type domain-containing protein n=1 Tax=Penstemon smallii TaxID=265156 RepID=A0ABD3S3F9_9LAMI
MKHIMHDAVSESFDFSSQKQKNNSFFNVPGLFVGFNPKTSESDSLRSPTSPLDFRIFSSFGNPFRCPKLQSKSWDCSKVGLSIVDSLADETKESGKVIRPSDSKNIIFGRQISPSICSHVSVLETPKSLPKHISVFPNYGAKPANIQRGDSDVIFEIGDAPFEQEPFENFCAFSLDSRGYRYRSHFTNFGNRKSGLGSNDLVPENKVYPMGSESRFFGGSLKSIHSGSGFIGSIPASEIELYEDYTCVTTHGPNPKVTHIFGDYILEHRNEEITDFSKKSGDEIATVEASIPLDVLETCTPNYFLKFCYSCHKNLDGEDIYMYRGEKAFCSDSCRSKEIEIDEKMEQSQKTNINSSKISDGSNSCEEIMSNI